MRRFCLFFAFTGYRCEKCLVMATFQGFKPSVYVGVLIMTNMSLKKHKWKKTTGWMGMILLVIALTACAGNDSETGMNAGGEANANQTETGNNSEQTNTDNNAPDDTAGETKQGTGTFVGFIDNHSAEIEMDGAPAAFQMDETLSAAAQSLEQGTPVSFEYVERPVEGDATLKQLILTKLEAAPAKGMMSELPAEKPIEVELEGMKETRTTTLAKGEGYAFYMFDIFSFDATTNKLMMNYDSDYHVVITKLPADYDIEELAKAAQSDMSKVGKVERRTGDQIYETMRDAELFLFAQGKGLTQQYIVKNVDGQGFAFLLNQPVGEASEGFGPLAFASINTVVATD